MPRNLIRPLGSTHIFTQSGWLILLFRIIFPGSTNWGTRQTLPLFQNFFVQDRGNDCPLSWIAATPPPWGKLSNLWAPCVYSLRPRVPSWIWIRWIQYATHRKNYWSRPLCRLRCKILLRHLATSSLGNIFWRHSRFSPKQPEPQTHGDYNIPVLNQQHDFCYTNGEYIFLTHSTMP